MLFFVNYTFKEDTNYELRLRYLDFFEFDFKDKNIYEYLREQFHIIFVHEAMEDQNPFVLNFQSVYNIKDRGNFLIAIRNAKHNNSDGFAVDTT